MKKTAILIPTLAVAMMINAVPAFSDEAYQPEAVPATGQKDECLLVARNCPDSVDTIQQRIEKLRGEINRGTDVYTPEELTILKQKFDDATRLLENMNEGG
jgi:hypothetical protein